MKNLLLAVSFLHLFNVACLAVTAHHTTLLDELKRNGSPFVEIKMNGKVNQESLHISRSPIIAVKSHQERHNSQNNEKRKKRLFNWVLGLGLVLLAVALIGAENFALFYLGAILTIVGLIVLIIRAIKK